jgi:hypothetical protein
MLLSKSIPDSIRDDHRPQPPLANLDCRSLRVLPRLTVPFLNHS